MNSVDDVIDQIRHWTRLTGLAAIVMSTATELHANTADCSNYHHPAQNLNAAMDNLKQSVLHIVSGKEEGTAFLIDNERALFLTARHVVAASITNKLTPVQGFFEEPKPKRYDLTIVKEDSALDVALLQGEPSMQSTDRPEFELSFEDLPSRKVGILGSGHSTNAIADINLRTAERFDFDVVSKLMKIPVAIRSGDSGAPVIKDDDGLVIGIVRHKKTTDLALVSPISDLTDFLSMNKLSKPMSDLFGGSTLPDEDGWHTAFQAKRNRHHSNFQLAGMIQSMHDRWLDRQKLAIHSKIKGCAIENLARNRELGKHATSLHVMANMKYHIANTPDAVLGAAEEQQKIGENQFALQLYEMATELYSLAIAENLKEKSGGGYVAALLKGSGYTATHGTNYPANLDNFTLANGGDTEFETEKFATVAEAVLAPGIDLADISVSRIARQKNKMAMLFHGHQTAQLKAAELSPQGISLLVAQDTFISAAWGSQIARSGPYRALNYQAMGDALIRLNRFSEAATAYATAWQDGLKIEVISKNYDYARSLAENRRFPLVVNFYNEIDTVDIMDPSTLHGIFTYIDAACLTCDKDL